MENVQSIPHLYQCPKPIPLTKPGLNHLQSNILNQKLWQAGRGGGALYKKGNLRFITLPVTFPLSHPLSKADFSTSPILQHL